MELIAWCLVFLAGKCSAMGHQTATARVAMVLAGPITLVRPGFQFNQSLCSDRFQSKATKRSPIQRAQKATLGVIIIPGLGPWKYGKLYRVVPGSPAKFPFEESHVEEPGLPERPCFTNSMFQEKGPRPFSSTRTPSQ